MAEDWGNGYEWTENFARHCEEQERQQEALDYGQHSTGRCEEEWSDLMDSARSEYTARHSILDRCSTPTAQSGQNLDDMVWYNHGTKAFQRVKGAQRIS